MRAPYCVRLSNVRFQHPNVDSRMSSNVRSRPSEASAPDHYHHHPQKTGVDGRYEERCGVVSNSSTRANATNAQTDDVSPFPLWESLAQLHTSPGTHVVETGKKHKEVLDNTPGAFQHPHSYPSSSQLLTHGRYCMKSQGISTLLSSRDDEPEKILFWLTGDFGLRNRLSSHGHGAVDIPA